jgi:hypothetical protein
LDIFGLLLIFAAVRKGKRMLRHGAPAGAVFTACRFFIKFRHKYYKQILTIENTTQIFFA